MAGAAGGPRVPRGLRRELRGSGRGLLPRTVRVSGSDSLKHERVLCGCQGNEIIEVIVFANSPVGIQRVRLPVTGRPEQCGL